MRTVRGFYGEFNSPSYRKECRLPPSAFPKAARRKQKEFRRREKKLERMGWLVRKAGDALSNNLTGPPQPEAWLKQAGELYREAGGRNFWDEVGAFDKQITKSFSLGENLILETAF